MAGEGEEHHDRIAELVDAVAHGDGVVLAGQSGQVAMEQQHHRVAAVVREPPEASEVVGQGDLWGKIAHLHHLVTASATGLGAWALEMTR